MPRFIAFLRAINVGGHVVTMDRLRGLFESMDLTGGETFIASGNVIFNAAASPRALEDKIGKGLKEALGYEVAVFIRTPVELAAIAGYRPFPQTSMDCAKTFVIGFLADALDEGAKKKLLALKTRTDDFHVHGREIYWLSSLKQSESAFSNTVLEKILGRQMTLRGANTVMKIAGKYPPDFRG